jgi:hypothetical protein
MNNRVGFRQPFSYIDDMMKEQDKFNGLSKGQVKQIIRRNMITRVSKSAKVYDRKRFKRDLES